MTPDPVTDLERAVALLAQFVIDTSALAQRRADPRARQPLDVAVVAARSALLRALDEPAVAARFARMPMPRESMSAGVLQAGRDAVDGEKQQRAQPLLVGLRQVSRP